MDRYALLNTKYIDDESSLEQTYIQTPNMYYGARPKTDIFGTKFAFHIPNDYDGLFSMSIRCTLSTSGDNSNIAPYLGTRIFKNIELRTRRGIVIGRLFPEYIYSRIDQLFPTTLGKGLYISSNTNESFDNNTVDVWVPLFFWFTEDISMKLRTRYLEPLELYCEVADTYVTMGLDVTLSSATFELHMNFLEKRNEEPFVGGTFYGYDIYMENQEAISSGTTSKDMFLTCPYPIFTSTFKLTSTDNQSEVEINKFEMKTLARIWLTKYRQYMYDLTDFSNDKNFYIVDGSPLSYKYTDMINRKDTKTMKNFMSFSDSMKPTYCHVEFDDPGQDAVLSCFHEYLQEYTIDEMGMFSVPKMGLFDENRD